MTQPYIGQIQPYAFNFAPKSWAFCNGQILPIAQNQALFSLLGTTYGGNGVSTFALPNLQSRVPMHMGPGLGGTYVAGETAGEENVTLSYAQMPAHSHLFMGASVDATLNVTADGGLLATSTGGGGQPENFYASDAAPQPLNPQTVGSTGGNQPHTNLQPYLAVNWCICLYGIFPSRN